MGRNAVKMDVSGLASGIYFVKLRGTGVVERLVKL
ncbi:MAG: hypothetical protein ACI9XO_000792 [Paraglaciecola sp.]|jgi:hypothetical protein